MSDLHRLIALALLLLALVIVIAAVRRSLRPPVPPSPYRRKASLFSQDERRFYNALRQATGDQFLVFAQMRLIDLIEVPRGDAFSGYWYAKVRYKHVDFVLCDRQSTAPLLAIELDGASHQSAIQQQRDREKDAVLEQAGLPLVRIPTQKGGYATKALASMIADALS